MMSSVTPCFSQQPELCLNGGTCINNSSACICPAEYISDDFLLHQGNCSLPANVFGYFLLYFSLLSAFVFLLLFQEWRYAQTAAYWLGGFALGLVVSMWLGMLLAYVQRGYFEGTIVFICMAEVLLSCVTYYLFLSFILPFYTINRTPKRRLERGLFAGSTVASVGMVVFAAAQLVYARDALLFNQIQLVHGATFLCIVAVCVCALVWHSWRLVKLLGSFHRNGDLPARRLLEVKSLEKRTKLMALSLVSLFTLIVGVLIAFLVVDSTHYFGCALLLAHFPALLVGGVIRFLRTSHRHKHEHSTVGYLVENNGDQQQQKRKRYDNNLDVSWTRTKQMQQQQQVNESGKHRAIRSAVEEESDYYYDDSHKVTMRIGELEEYQQRPTQDYRRRAGDVVVSSSAAPQLSRNSDLLERAPTHKPFWQFNNTSTAASEVEVEDVPPPLPSLPSNLSVVGKTSRISGRYYHRPSLKGAGGAGVEEVNINSVYESDVMEVDISRISVQSRPFSYRLGMWGKPRSKSSLGFAAVSKFASSKGEEEPNF